MMHINIIITFLFTENMQEDEESNLFFKLLTLSHYNN